MKKLLLIGLILLMTTAGYCADGDFDLIKVRPDTAKAWLDTFKILRFTKTMIVTFREMDASGNPVGAEFDITFIDVPEDESTPEIELKTEFTDFYNFIHTRIRAGDTLKEAIEKGVCIKTGICPE